MLPNMQTKQNLFILLTVMVLGLMVWSAPMVYAAQYLTVNGEPVDSITLELGQSCTVEVVSDDSTSYTDYVGFDSGVVLGRFLHYETTPLAGGMATVTEHNEHDFYGYGVTAAGKVISAGIHFIFEYEAQQVGETDVKLYDISFTKVIDSVPITVIPLQPVAIGTAITYQGRLIDANDVADGLYDFQFKLYDNADSVFAAQQGSTIDINDLDVIDGQFAVELDFGSDVFAGDARWLEIGVRPGEFSDPCEYTILEPRVELTPTPYALYAEKAGGDSDWIISGYDMYSAVSGNVGIGTAIPQEKLDVDGPINTDSVYKIAGDTVLSTLGTDNTFVGIEAGANNTTGFANTFVGEVAGYSNNTGFFNTFVGEVAGYSNTTGYRNTFLGLEAGNLNTIGNCNTFLGQDAGRSNTEGNYNTFLGVVAGASNQTGVGNVFIGCSAGFNETGSDKLYIANSDADPPLIYGDFSTGRIGIGTTSPQNKLDVEGAVAVGVSYSGTNTAPSNGMIIQGNVGIGTDSPLAKLHVEESGSLSPLRVRVSGTTKLIVNNAGNVGIGTTSPDEKLTVVSSEAGSTAVYGEASDTSDLINTGGYFTAAGSYGRGVRGSASGIRGHGVWGSASNTADGYKNYGGYFTASGGVGRGVYGKATGSSGRGVYGVASGSSGRGVYGEHSASGNYGYLGGASYGVYGRADGSGDRAGYFKGSVNVTGTLYAGAIVVPIKLFKIDHPLDPENKYLKHVSVESSEIMNVYSGNVVLDENGEAQVQLPDWFEALNTDFRYQLTCIGGFAQVYIAEEISNNRFKIAGGPPAMKVSWHVAGVRHDPYAEDNPLEVEEDKPAEERGYYMYPEGYGYGQEKSINSLNDSEAIEQLEELESEVTDERS